MRRKSQKNSFAIPASDLAHILNQATNEFESLRGKRIFITGGTGFFGKWLLGALLEANAERDLNLQLTVLSRDPAAFLERFPLAAAEPALRFMAGDVADFSPTKEPYDFIMHAAADTVVASSGGSEENRSRAITAGTHRILDLSRTSGAARLLYISSGAVYGARAGQLTGAKEDDDATAQPTTAYAEAKRAAEALCAESGLDFVTARAFAFFGPHLPLDAHFAAGNFLRDALRGGPVLVRGDGTALRSYLHPADLVIWLLRILLRGERFRAYNVGSNEIVSTAQLARRMADAIDPAMTVTIQSVQPQGPQNIYLPNIARAQTELGLSVAIPLSEAITRTIAFVKSDLP